MAPLVTRNRLNAGVAALLLSALVLSACKLGGGATATPTTAPAAAATVTQGEGAAVEATAAPPPTADNSILFEDDFSDDDSGWPTVQADHALASYQNPELYRLDVNAAQVVLLASRPGAFSDFSLETIVTGSGGAGGQMRYGVLFRHLTPDNYYAAFVNPVTQGFLVAKRLLGEWTTLAEGQNAAIPTTAGPVTLRIDAQGPNLTFSINGVGLVTLVDSSFAAGDVGYALETIDAASARLDADSIVIRRFNADTVPDAPAALPVVPTATETPSAGDASDTPPPPTVRPVGTVKPPATQSVPSTQALQATLSAAGTALAATAGAAATQACALLGCP